MTDDDGRIGRQSTGEHRRRLLRQRRRPRKDKEGGKEGGAKSAVLCSSRRRQTVDKLPKVLQSGRRENRLPLSADSTKSGIESHETVRSSWVEKKVTEEERGFGK